MTEAIRILVVEDDRQISRFLQVSLTAAGFLPQFAYTLAEAKQRIETEPPNLVILDLGLPDGEGTDFIRMVRERSDMPILVLSARQAEQEKVTSLNLGADDYLEKPFGVEELLARLRTALRRLRLMTLRDQVYEVGGLRIDRVGGTVALDEAPVHLSPIEFKLLMILVQRPGRIYPHRELLAQVWGAEYVDDTHYLRIHMGRLRSKLEADPSQPRYLMTELGIGYRLAAQ
jgi:two-component system KDP operon response regulator KdpE